MAARPHRRSGGPAPRRRRGRRRPARRAARCVVLAAARHAGGGAGDAAGARPRSLAGALALAGRKRTRPAGDGVTRNLPPGPRWAGFPDLSAAPESCADLLTRWTAVLDRAPRLRPWLTGMIAHRRALLSESAIHTAAANVERALWTDLERLLPQFERLPQFAVAAIATTLTEDRAAPVFNPLRTPSAFGSDGAFNPVGTPSAFGSDGVPVQVSGDSPERAVAEIEALLSDPVFALAFHCVEARIRPALQPCIPESSWFGLLHASAAPQPLLTPDVAVTLVLRVMAADWLRLPSASRAAALRLFHASAADLKAQATVDRLRAALPWPVDPGSFVEGAGQARAALTQACGLCARIAGAVKKRSGGFAVLQPVRPAQPAAPELAELSRTASKYVHMEGFRKLLSLL